LMWMLMFRIAINLLSHQSEIDLFGYVMKYKLEGR
jgi:hypothetical protein